MFTRPDPERLSDEEIWLMAKETVQNGVVTALGWVSSLLQTGVSFRKRTKAIALKGLLNFKKGKPSPEGEELVKGLLEKMEFIGFAPSISYIMENSRYRDELESIWVHAFSVPALLYKHKTMPILIVANANLDYNGSVLSKIDQNKFQEGLTETLKGIRGITG